MAASLVQNHIQAATELAGIPGLQDGTAILHNTLGQRSRQLTAYSHSMVAGGLLLTS